MAQIDVLVPLQEIPVHSAELLSIQRNHLVPLLNDQYRLNHYAEAVIQAQSLLLDGVDPQLNLELSHVIEQLIQSLADSKKYLKKRKFNGLQKWLGVDIEYGSTQIEYYKKLDHLLDQANLLSQKLQIEIQKAQARYQQLTGLREQMAKYIAAAEGFLNEYPKFVKNVHPLDNFSERLSKKINSLQTLQASNDIAMTQMQLSQQLSLNLLDRYKEAQQVLIPAWQYYVKQSQQSGSMVALQHLDSSREKLIHSLKKSLQQSMF